MWDLPGPGIEPVAPALAGRFLTTAPPGKSNSVIFKLKIILNDLDGDIHIILASDSGVILFIDSALSKKANH